MSVLMHAIHKNVPYYLNFPIGQKLNVGQFWNLVVKVCDVNTPESVSAASCSAPQTLQASLVRSWVDWDACPRAERVTSCLRKAYLTRAPRWKDISFQWVTARRSVGCVYSAALRMWTYAIQLFVFGGLNLYGSPILWVSSSFPSIPMKNKWENMSVNI